MSEEKKRWVVTVPCMDGVVYLRSIAGALRGDGLAGGAYVTPPCRARRFTKKRAAFVAAMVGNGARVERASSR